MIDIEPIRTRYTEPCRLKLYSPTTTRDDALVARARHAHRRSVRALKHAWRLEDAGRAAEARIWLTLSDRMHQVTLAILGQRGPNAPLVLL